MSENDVDPLSTNAGFLTERMREYLRDPERFEAERDSQTVTQVRSEIRDAREAARVQLRYLDKNVNDWQKVQPIGDVPEDLEDHIDPIPLHKPLPDAETYPFNIHEDTHEALRRIQTDLSEYIVDYIIDNLNELPEEFDSKMDLREHFDEHRREYRTELDSRRRKEYEMFRGDDFITVDDVIRMALRLVPEAELLRDVEDEVLLMMPGVRPEVRYEMLKLFSESIDEHLLKERSETL